MLHSPLLQLTKNRRHLGHLKLSFYYSTFITNNEVKNENALVFQKPAKYRQRRDFHSNLSYRFPRHGCRSFTFVQDDALPSVITQNGGRKRIFILFFCVIPPSQYPPSGFAGHLLINKEAYPIPILSVRIPFLNTAANPLLAL